MATPERRRGDRHAVDLPGELFLSHGRSVAVRIVNLGGLGALLAVGDLEEAVLEGERVVLRHPASEDDARFQEGAGEFVRTPGSVVRVELDFAETGVTRHLAVFFDGGAEPDGYAAG